MAQFLKQSTAATIMFGPFVDKTDGITLKTDATTITDIDHASTGIFLSKAGAAAAIRHASVTASVADAYGMMKVTLDTTDTGTLGTLDVLFAKAATYLPVHKSFMVLTANVYDSLVAGSDKLDVDTFQVTAGAITATAIATGAIDADALAADTITAAKVAADVSTEIATAVAAPTAATIAAAVWDLDATGHTTQGTFGQAIGDPIADTNSIFKAVVTDATGATVGVDVVDLKTQIGTAGAGLTAADDAVIAAIPSAATVAAAVWDLDATTHQTQGTFGQAIGDPAADTHTIYDAVVTAAAGVNIAADIIAVKAETATIVADTNELQTDWTNGGRLDLILDIIAADTTTDIPASIAALNDLNATEIEDAVWDAVMANHLDVGSTGAALSAAGAAGDPWITPIPGVYIAGQAGYVVGTTLVGELAKVPKSDGVLTFNATCSSDIKSGLSTQAELNKVPKSDSNVTWNATALASIQTEANDAIVANRLDELLAADSDIDGAAPPTVGSVFHELMTKTAGSFTYDQTTDSLEAIRDRGDAAWTTATGFSTFDPTTDPVLLADGAHGGSSTTITAKSISVVNNTNNGVAVNIQGTGTGNSHGINLSSVNGKALAIGAVGNAVSIDSSAANGLVVTGATGDIVADITGAISSVGNIADAVWDEAIADHLGAGSTGAALNGASAPTAAAVADAVWEEAIADHSGTVGSTAAKLAASSSQTSVDDLPTNGELATALGTADDAVLTAIADLPTAIENADALLNRDMSTGTDSGSATVRTPRQALRFLRNKWAPDGLGNIKIYKEDDVTESWKFVPTATPGASPITETDPEGP